jgi:hypothetical protein
MSKFTVAKEISLYSQDVTDGPMNPLAPKYKGIVNAENHSQIFNVVGMGYKIAQHDEVFEAIEQTVKELGFKADITPYVLDEGGRLKVRVTFPDINLHIGPREVGDIVNLRMTFDNSYNATTGLRGCVDGLRLKCTNGMTVPEKFAYSYHKHTKGMDINKLCIAIEKGVETFQTKIKEKWERYQATKINPDKARIFLQELAQKEEGKKTVISKKYLDMMLERMDWGGSIDVRGAGMVTNQWMLYNLATEILTHECKSPDVQERFAGTMDRVIDANISKLI